ncbi:MAG: hypothetical protein Q8L26_01635 [Candidatus Omnitrophota bacterium]|nr:hypothetical protein [Candidatus Omnitrophota bacterium]
MNKKNYSYSWVKLFCFFLLFVNMRTVYAQGSHSADAIWVIDQSVDNAVIKLSGDGRKTLARIKELKPPTDIEIDQRDGAIWVTYKADSSLVKYSADGKDKLLEVKKTFCTPRHSSLSLKENAIWIGSWTQGELIKFSLEGKQLLRIQNLGNIYEVLVSPFDDAVWVGDQKLNKFIHFSSSGKMLGFTQRRLGKPFNLAIDANNGSLWAIFHDSGKVVKFSHQGKFIFLVEDFNLPEAITIDPQDGSVWVTDVSRGELTHISSEGKVLKKIGGFTGCSGLSLIDPEEKTFWMANTAQGEIIKFSTTGEILDRVRVGGNPKSVIVYKRSK